MLTCPKISAIVIFMENRTLLRIAGIVEESIVDGPGLRLAVFTQGCFHNCPGCHNPQTHDPDGGKFVDIGEIAAMARENPLLAGVTFSGGEPFLQADALAKLADMLKPKMNIIAYTGYTYERLLKMPEARPLLDRIDILIDGPFIEAEKSMDLMFRGSRNQRAINIPESLKSRKIVEAWKPERKASPLSPR